MRTFENLSQWNDAEFDPWPHAGETPSSDVSAPPSVSQPVAMDDASTVRWWRETLAVPLWAVLFISLASAYGIATIIALSVELGR